MDWELKAKQLQRENARLKKQLELAAVANGKTKSIRHLLALTEKDIGDESFTFKGEPNLSASEYFSRLQSHPDYSPLMGQGSGSNAASANPWSKESFNLTKQMQLTRTNPALAAELKKKAGR